jgi:hypothetical protein
VLPINAMKSRRLIASSEAQDRAFWQFKLSHRRGPDMGSSWYRHVRFGSKADIDAPSSDVRFTPKADIAESRCQFRFVPKADIGA